MDEDNAPTAYNDTNRAFLQAFMAQGTLTYDEARPILAALFSIHGKCFFVTEEEVTEEDFKSYVNAAIDALSPFDYSIVSTKSQTNKDLGRVYVLVNTISDSMTQLATIHSAEEIAYLKRILDAIFETYNTQKQEVLAISSLQAIKLSRPPDGEDRRLTQGGRETQGSAGTGMTKQDAEKCLNGLVDEGWFDKSPAGFYTLSTRALTELKHYLLSTYNTQEDEADEDEDVVSRVKLCWSCKDIITIGERCPKMTCPIRLHDVCTAGYWRSQRSKVCPQCKTPWTGKNFVGERAITTTESFLKGTRRSGAGRQSAASQVAGVSSTEAANDSVETDEN
ncbi:MAG: hypothetical protein M1829_006901 [Trizodia sp. TS-e1964]|nr:MAG: hypothetical protein M1829_006901 [Trizodia sp. TS-e1964]